MPLRAVYLGRRVSLVHMRFGATALGDRVKPGPPQQRDVPSTFRYCNDRNMYTDMNTDNVGIDVTSDRPSVYGRFKYANT